VKIRPVGAELFHEDGQTDNTELIAAFYNFANAPRNWFLYSASGLATRVCILG